MEHGLIMATAEKSDAFHTHYPIWLLLSNLYFSYFSLRSLTSRKSFLTKKKVSVALENIVSVAPGNIVKQIKFQEKKCERGESSTLKGHFICHLNTHTHKQIHAHTYTLFLFFTYTIPFESCSWIVGQFLFWFCFVVFGFLLFICLY